MKNLGKVLLLSALLLTPASLVFAQEVIETNNVNTNTTTVDSTSTNTNNNINTSTSTSDNTNTNINTSTSTNTNTNINTSDVTSNNTNTNINTSTSVIDSTNTNNNNNNTIINETSNSNINQNINSNNTNTNNNNNTNTSTSTNTNNNNNNNTSTSTNQNTNQNYNMNRSEIEQTIKSPPPSAIAPSISATNIDLCTVGVSGAVQTQILGISGGATVRDLNCERLKLSKTLYDMGMKVAAVSTLCQDERVFNAMMMAGTPCPYNGAIGEEAKALWGANPDETPMAIEKEQRRNDTLKGGVIGAGSVLLLLLLL